MVRKTQKIAHQNAYVTGKRFEYRLPKANITKILFAGTHTSCTGGTYTVNTAVEWYKVRVNGRGFMDISGEKDADAVPFGILLWREFYKQKKKVALPNEHFYIHFPFPIPKNAQIELIFKCSIQTDVGTCTSAVVHKWDILIEHEDKFTGKAVIPYVFCDKFDHAALDGDQINFTPAMPYRLRAIVFLTEDNGTIQSGDYGFINISTPTKVYFDGSMAALEAKQEAESGIALTDGYYIMRFPEGLKVNARELQIKMNIPTAVTDLETHLLYICY